MLTNYVCIDNYLMLKINVEKYNKQGKKRWGVAVILLGDSKNNSEQYNLTLLIFTQFVRIHQFLLVYSSFQPNFSKSFKTFSSVWIFKICVSSNLSPTACLSFKVSIALNFFNNDLIFFSSGEVSLLGVGLCTLEH